ncbi:UdgX family uracil-DNA binding protein [Caballeronia sp. LZ062]|uniref:UdgX family uracil-DNA binding protein n=1 Tax=unclassified Caballeronia TaxID=2646786 RepID=UPI00285F5CE5|nr:MULTISPECIES: UdgX family uracil-DNA binding protein [unclassified Caballeronia]MDR5856498.1 UdgX family uracil-DNA binding protein [Caballeronia sp. LZ050]MDR5873168.1 UdgX family uracil-DNA binding protein [Caballeronia sp. LZ062]
MHVITIDDDFGAWRSAALGALAQDLKPESIEWRTQQSDTPALFAASAEQAAPSADAAQVRVSREFAALLKDAAHFRDERRWGFLYRVLWRWAHGDRSVASAADEDGARLYKMAKAVRRAQHDMIAYVRFRQRDASLGAPEYVAWYEPDHDVLAWSAEHFAARMGQSTWLITTPDGAAMWNGERLEIERRRALASDHASDTPDAAEALWMTYYRSIFNPARLNESVLEQQMPVRFWKGLPEGALIPQLVSDARGGARRVAQARAVGALRGKAVQVEAQDAQPEREAPTSLDMCRRCDLWRHATQAVHGAGPADARIMLLGEQPGDQEDLRGEPFVGPAGQLLDDAMRRAQVPREQVYLTNAVKHFKWEPRGKRRLHKTPAQQEVEACSYWLERELDRTGARVIVTLGATALTALLGKRATLRAHVGRVVPYGDKLIVATYHPSYALRQLDDAAREKTIADIVDALAKARSLVEETQTLPR